jgi:4'-phosphopantetheinyl transferase
MTAMIAPIDVFWTDLDIAASAALPRWQALLDDSETARAACFRFARDRDRYIACHGILRTLLAHSVGRPARALRFDVGSRGKPALSDRAAHFNISHSHHLALIAISRNVTVGCDIELHDDRFLNENIPAHFFSPAEIAELNALPQPERLAAFFAGWTRKEAYIKARGLGLSLPLDSFDVSLAPSARPALHRGCAGWSARAFEPLPHCSAAVIAEGEDWPMNAQPLDALSLLDESAAHTRAA